MKLIVNVNATTQAEINRLISTIRTLQGVRSVEQSGEIVKEIITGRTTTDPTGPRPLFG